MTFLPPILACATCLPDQSTDVAQASNMAILFMVVIVFAMFGMLLKIIFNFARKQRAVHRHRPLIPMSMPTTLAFFSINKLLGIPELASEHGEMVDHMLELVHWFMLVLFVGWSAFLVVVFTKFRRERQTEGRLPRRAWPCHHPH